MRNIFSETSSAYTHNGDADLLRSLGLSTGPFQRDWTDLGTVVVREAEPEGEFGPRPGATVKVEVSALPAQFFRFTITRPRDESETVDGEVRGVYEPLEHFEIRTGSGGFGTYWPFAVAVAEHMIDVERLDPSRLAAQDDPRGEADR